MVLDARGRWFRTGVEPGCIPVPLTVDEEIADGRDEIGTHNPGNRNFYLDVNGSGRWDGIVGGDRLARLGGTRLALQSSAARNPLAQDGGDGADTFFVRTELGETSTIDTGLGAAGAGDGRSRGNHDFDRAEIGDRAGGDGDR